MMVCEVMAEDPFYINFSNHFIVVVRHMMKAFESVFEKPIFAWAGVETTDRQFDDSNIV